MVRQQPSSFANSQFLMNLLRLRQLLEQQAATQEKPKPAEAQPSSPSGSSISIKDITSLIKSIYGDTGGAAPTSVATPATQAVWNAGAIGSGGMSSTPALSGTVSTPAELASYNSAADAATVNAGGALGTETAAESSVAEAAPYLAVAASALNSGQALFNKNNSDEQKAYDGAMAIPRAVGAYYTSGLSNLAESFARKKFGGTMNKVDKALATSPLSPIAIPMAASRFWTSDKWKTEGNRIAKLEKNGIKIPNINKAMIPTRGRKFSEMENASVAKDFVGYDPKGQWTNNKFNYSRNEADLKPEDIWGYSTFLEKFGNDWLGKYNEQQRKQIAQSALDAKAINEHHGTVDVDWSKVGDISKITAQSPAGTPVTPGVQQTNIPRPPPGQTARLSPGVYRNSSGSIQYGNQIPRADRSRR